MSSAIEGFEPLTATEVRILGCLIEKQATTPETYPLTLNALALACNQKTSREPVMNLELGELGAALRQLEGRGLVRLVMGSRADRWEHQIRLRHSLTPPMQAVLATLMLRGPQTAAELRLHTERLHRFADISSVEGFLDELAEREPKMVVKLPRAPGSREARWAHLLCGEVSVPAEGAQDAAGLALAPHAEEVAALRTELASVKAEVGALRALVLRLAGELGVEAELPPEA